MSSVNSILDSRYKDKIWCLPLGEDDFVYFMYSWSVAYSKIFSLTFPKKLLLSKKEVYERVKEKELVTKHQMVALLQVLKEVYPKETFHYGLTSEDIMHNARYTQVFFCLRHLSVLVHDICNNPNTGIHSLVRDVKYPILAHSHGQPATPVNVAMYLNAKVKSDGFSYPLFRLGGSNGQCTFIDYPRDIAEVWWKEVTTLIPEFYELSGKEQFPIVYPEGNTGLLQVGPSNEKVFMSGIAVASKLRALSRALWDHASRKILVVKSGKKQAGSSAMPHKVNPIEFENAEGAFTNAVSILYTAFEANVDSRGLRDLSNSIINRHMTDGWAYLYIGAKSLISGINSSSYSNPRIIAELRNNPECLSEHLRYNNYSKHGGDEYWKIKNSPPKNFDKIAKKVNFFASYKKGPF